MASQPSHVRGLPPGKKAVLTIIADDGEFRSGQLLNQLAEEFNIRFSVAGVVENILPRLEWWQANESRLEMVNHSWSHAGMDENTPQDLIWHEYIDARNFFVSHFTTPQICFVPAFNYIPEAGYAILEKAGVLAARQWHNGVNSLTPAHGREPGDWLNLQCYGIGDVPTEAERNSWLADALAQNGWLIEMWHNVYSDNAASGYQPLALQEARAHLRYACNLPDIWIATFTEAVARLYPGRMAYR